MWCVYPQPFEGGTFLEEEYKPQNWLNLLFPAFHVLHHIYSSVDQGFKSWHQPVAWLVQYIIFGKKVIQSKMLAASFQVNL